MNILLINPSWGGTVRSQRYNRRWPPLDLLNLAALLQLEGHRVSLCDARAEGLEPASASGAIAAADYVVVNTSPLDRWQCPNLDLDPLLAWTSAVPCEKLIVCGVHGTLFPARMMELTGAGMLIAGEPDASAPALFRALEGKTALHEVPGLSFTEEGQVRSAPAAAPFDLAGMPLPAYSLVRPEFYRYELLGKRLALLETARGCQNHCTFCLKTMYGPKIRMKSPEQVAAEIELVLGLGFKTIYFIDLEFTMMRERALALCDVFNNYGFRWCCQTRVDAVDAHLLRAMRKSGCALIHYGIESGSEKTRERIRKPVSNRQIEEAIIRTKEAGIASAGFFLFGFPQETQSDWKETARFARKLPLSYASFHKVTSYPGTVLGEARGQGPLPWWEETPARQYPAPDLTGAFLRFYLRPSRLFEIIRGGASLGGSLRLFAGFVWGTRTTQDPLSLPLPDGDAGGLPAQKGCISARELKDKGGPQVYSHPDSSSHDLTILIPLYNEEEILVPNLRRLLLFLLEAGIDAEVILASNGSTDATVLIGRKLAEIRPGRIRFFHIEGRGEVGRVFKIAVGMASAPFLISLDMDLSIDLEFIPVALELLKENHVIVGSKQSGSQSRSPIRLIGSRLFILCAQVLLGLRYNDYSIGAKAYRMDSLRRLIPGISDDTSYVLDMLCRAQQSNLKIEVLPIACADWRKSRFRLLREGLIRFGYLFRLWRAESRKSGGQADISDEGPSR